MNECGVVRKNYSSRSRLTHEHNNNNNISKKCITEDGNCVKSIHSHWNIRDGYCLFHHLFNGELHQQRNSEIVFERNKYGDEWQRTLTQLHELEHDLFNDTPEFKGFVTQYGAGHALEYDNKQRTLNHLKQCHNIEAELKRYLKGRYPNIDLLSLPDIQELHFTVVAKERKDSEKNLNYTVIAASAFFIGVLLFKLNK